MPTLALHLHLRFCDLTGLFQTHKPLAGCLGICTSLTLPHCMVNDTGASPELLNKSPLFGGVKSPTCSAQDLHLGHQSGLSSQENCLLLFLFGFLMPFVQVHSFKRGFFRSLQSWSKFQLEQKPFTVMRSLIFISDLQILCCITEYCSVLFKSGVGASFF